ncbi:spermatogenesis-associated protein 9 [Carettochelys insculpta]|uniref:spermatogenesis-associated protein 9 n=1 Tax=Carettochelys insculpta TaxID=44489 RepID=UPI003EC0D2B0
MPIKPIGWICGQVIKRFSGQAYVIQRAVVGIIDELKDEFPTIIRLQQSNQIDPILQASRSVVASTFSSSPGIRVINELNRISTSSKSMAKILQPQLVQNFAELNTMSHRLLNVNIPKQPLYKNQGRTFSLFDVISYPAKTALTSVMCASYAALIYVAISISTVLGKIKSIVKEEKASRENTKNEEEIDGISKYKDSARYTVSSPKKQVSSEFPVEDSTKSSIHILHSALDQNT